MEELKVLDIIGDGLVRIQHSKLGVQIWIRTAKRTVHGAGKHCVYCGRDLSGQNAYRPTGNPRNKGMRLCIEHVQPGAVLPLKDPTQPEDKTEGTDRVEFAAE